MPKVDSPAVSEPANPFSTNHVGSGHRCEKSFRAHEIGRAKARRADLDGTRAGHCLGLGEFLKPWSGTLVTDDEGTHAIFLGWADRGSVAGRNFLDGQCTLRTGLGTLAGFLFEARGHPFLFERNDAVVIESEDLRADLGTDAVS